MLIVSSGVSFFSEIGNIVSFPSTKLSINKSPGSLFLFKFFLGLLISIVWCEAFSDCKNFSSAERFGALCGRGFVVKFLKLKDLEHFVGEVLL